MFIPHQNLQAKLHASPWFLPPCVAAITQKKSFLSLKIIDLLYLGTSFDKLVIWVKGF